jgi:hypothetical protein
MIPELMVISNDIEVLQKQTYLMLMKNY